MPPTPARVNIQDISQFLAETEGVSPEEQQMLRQSYFDKYVMQHWNTFTEQQRGGMTQAFGQGIKMPPVSADADYRRDLMARGGNPNDPVQAGGGAVGLGATAQSVGDEFMRSGPQAALWEAGPFGGTSSAMDPMGYMGGAARGLFAGARLPVDWTLKTLPKMLMSPNPVMQRSAMQVIKDMGLKSADWGSAGLLPMASMAGRALWRRLPFGQGGVSAAGGAAGHLPTPGAPTTPGVPSVRPPMPDPRGTPAELAERLGEGIPGAPRPRARYGADEMGNPSLWSL